MTESFKLKNNNYLDSTSIVHNKEALSNILNKLYVVNKAELYNGNTTSTTFTIKNPNQLRQYFFYIATAAGNKLFIGILLISEGKIIKHKILSDDVLIPTINNDILTIKFNAPWFAITMIGRYAFE